MLPADGIGATPTSATPTSSIGSSPPDASPATRRLARALERIAEALVRRTEVEAAARDRFEHEPHIQSERAPDGALESDTVEDIRHRVDAAILLVARDPGRGLTGRHAEAEPMPDLNRCRT